MGDIGLPISTNSYANIPYVQCSETLIISGSCVFLLPLPFELKFWFFEFEYVM